MFSYSSLRPLIFLLPAEQAHHLAIMALRHGLISKKETVTSPHITQTLFGLEFLNPVGMAPGFDKNADVIKGLLQQGFGFVETGTVTPEPQHGNPKPRLFRLAEDEAIINRMGFNNKGASHYKQQLYQHYDGIVGANIGKNKDTKNALDDYTTMMYEVYGLSDYITINISSPNTPGLRDLQKKEALSELCENIMALRNELGQKHGNNVPVLVKISPDEDQESIENIAQIALETKIDGLIVSNTTIVEREQLTSKHARQTGGLSGAPLMKRSTATLKQLYQLTEGRVPLIGVGGIASAEDAYQKIRSGASLVQLYSALIYHGFGLVGDINSGIEKHLKNDGFSHISEAIGVDC